jgi:hypothetical protein
MLLHYYCAENHQTGDKPRQNSTVQASSSMSRAKNPADL